MTTSYSYDVLADGKVRRRIRWFLGGVVCTVIVGATVVMLMKLETPAVLHPADAKTAVAMTTASAAPPAIAASAPASTSIPAANLHPADAARSAGAQQVAPLAVLVAGTGSKTVPSGQSFPEAQVPQGSGGSGMVALPSTSPVYPVDAKAGRSSSGSGVYEAESEKPVAVMKDVPRQPLNPSVADLVGVPTDGYVLIQVGSSVRPYAVGSILPSGETLARADSKTGIVETRR